MRSKGTQVQPVILVDPARDEVWPSGHGRQTVELIARVRVEYVPALHAMHSFVSTTYDPAGPKPTMMKGEITS